MIFDAHQNTVSLNGAEKNEIMYIIIILQGVTKFRLRRTRKDLHTLNKGVLHAR